MRSRLNWLVLAVTALVVVAFVIPLGLLVRRQAAERAQVNAEQRAQSAAAALVVAVAAADGRVDAGVAESALVTNVGIVLPDGTAVGSTGTPSDLTDSVMSGRPGAATTADGSWFAWIPVATQEGIVAVVATATLEEMTAGVWLATGLLAALGLALVAGSVLLADRMGRSLVGPVKEAAGAALKLAEGDLAVRVPLQGPPEIKDVAAALNVLANRLSDIIDNERQALADLSHRLRTPLTALRLEAEKLHQQVGSDQLLDQVDRTQEAVDQLIRDVGQRGRGADQSPRSDLVDVIRRRLTFWSVLAADQNRELKVDLGAESISVAATESEIAAAIDALIGNIFAHTPPGTAFDVTVKQVDGVPVLSVSDRGPGFVGSDPVRRGASGAGSTGLGLAIARNFAEQVGGSLTTDEDPAGGALVTVRLG